MSSYSQLPAGAAANTNREEDRQYLFFLLLAGNRAAIFFSAARNAHAVNHFGCQYFRTSNPCTEI